MISITIDAGLVDHLFQFGFLSTASNFAASGVFYDNINFAKDGVVGVESETWGAIKGLYH